MKKHTTTIILIIIFVIGLSLLLYPSISDYVNSLHQSKAVTKYAEDVSNLDSEEYAALLQQATDYNIALAQKPNQWDLSDEELSEYNETLNIGGKGMMGYIEIPKINCFLPIYHGTDDGTLQTSIGHIPGSSLPVGGVGTHCVLSGHRGLPSAKLFSELDKLVEGDQFVLRTLDEILTYEVDQILIVLPEEIDSLNIEKDKDYCTLVTCTPYGVNSHRLLVRGHRVDNDTTSKTVRVSADAIQIEPVIVAPIIAIPIVLILLIYIMTKHPKKNLNRRK